VAESCAGKNASVAILRFGAILCAPAPLVRAEDAADLAISAAIRFGNILTASHSVSFLVGGVRSKDILLATEGPV
jgi:hypothetical protein